MIIRMGLCACFLFPFWCLSLAGVFLHSTFERGQTYLAKKTEPGIKTVYLEANSRLEEWPLGGGQGLVEGNWSARSEEFTYTERIGNRLKGVTGLTKNHPKWADIRTVHAGDWAKPSSLSGSLFESEFAPRVVSDTVLPGGYSVLLDARSPFPVRMQKRFPSQSPQRLFCRFYVRFSSVDLSKEPVSALPLCFLGRGQATTSRASLVWQKAESQARFGLSGGSAKDWQMVSNSAMEAGRIPLQAHRPYCLEMRACWIDFSTVELDLLVDDKYCARQILKATSPGGFFDAIAVGKLSRKPLDLNLWLDEIVISDEAIGMLPPRPEIKLREGLLYASPESKGPAFPKVQWQVSSSNAWVLPEFNSGELDAEYNPLPVPYRFKLHGSGPVDMAFREPVFVPFPIEAGREYLARARLGDGRGKWGDWSVPLSFQATEEGAKAATATSGLPLLKKVFITAVGGKSPLPMIERGKWYDLHLHFAKGTANKKVPIGFADLFLSSDPAECQSSYYNRGGGFLPSSNYSFSYSFAEGVVFVKRIPGSTEHTRLIKMRGSYYDASEGRSAFSIDEGWARVGFRLSDSADVGPWVMRGFVREIRGLISPMYQDLVYVVDEMPAKPKAMKIIPLAAFVLVVLGAGMAVRRKRARTGLDNQADLPAQEKVELNIDGPHRERVESAKQYIEENFCQPILSKDVAYAIGVTPNWLSTFFCSSTGKTVVQYINELRIEEAKKLLKESSMSVSEISTKTGFGGFSSFRKNFREATGMSPGKFRKKYG